MGFFRNFPYTNFHEMNLDWLLEEMEKLKLYVEQYTAINKVEYGGIWDITKQYPRWTIVSNRDTTWLSLQPVPVGIPLENADYWQKMADLDPRIAGIIVKISEIENEITENEKKISKIGKNVDSLSVNIIDFGANVLNEDNADAIQTAINSIKNTGGVVFVPDGVWIISRPLVIDTNITLRGNGRSSIIKLSNNANCDMLVSYGYDRLIAGTLEKEPYQFTVENIVLDGNRNNNNNGDGIKFFGADYDIKNVVVKNVAQNGIVANGNVEKMTIGTKIESLFENVDIMFTGENGLVFNGPTDSYMENITVVNASQNSDNIYDSIVFNNNCRCVHMHPWNFNDRFGFKRPRYALLINASNCIIDDSHIEGGRTASLRVNTNVVGGTISNTMIYASLGQHLIEMGGKYFTLGNCTLSGKAPESTAEYLNSIKFLDGATSFVYTGMFLENNPITDTDVAGSTYVITIYSPEAINFEKQLQYSIYIIGGARQFANMPNVKTDYLPYTINYDAVNSQPVFYNPNTGGRAPYPGAVMYRDGSLKRYDVNNGWVAI